MSSFVSITGQKIKELFGGNVTKIPELEAKKQQINQSDQYFRILASISHQLQDQLKNQTTIHQQLGQVLFKIYETQNGKDQANDFQTIFQEAATQIQEKNKKLSQVNDHINQWFTTIEQLREILKSCEDQRVVYDHYNDKLDKLKQKYTSGSDELNRNEKKYDDAKHLYQKTVNEVVYKMDNLLGYKMTMINNYYDSLISLLRDNCSSNLKSYEKGATIMKHLNSKINSIQIGGINLNTSAISLGADKIKEIETKTEQIKITIDDKANKAIEKSQIQINKAKDTVNQSIIQQPRNSSINNDQIQKNTNNPKLKKSGSLMQSGLSPIRQIQNPNQSQISSFAMQIDPFNQQEFNSTMAQQQYMQQQNLQQQMLMQQQLQQQQYQQMMMNQQQFIQPKQQIYQQQFNSNSNPFANPQNPFSNSPPMQVNQNMNQNQNQFNPNNPFI